MDAGRYLHPAAHNPVAEQIDDLVRRLPPSVAETELRRALERLQRRPPPTPPHRAPRVETP